jgi:hypothetical protein
MPSCRICLVEFEPKTPTIPVVNGAVHYGCYASMVGEVARESNRHLAK